MAAGDLKKCLKTILRSEVLAEEPTKEGKIILREEPQTNQEEMRFTVNGASSTITAVRLSKTSHLSALARGKGCGWNKICDYMLCDDLGDKCHITLIELKKTLREGRSEAFEQLRRSLPVAKYLISVCSVERHTSWQYEVSYVLIAQKQVARLDKQGVHPQPGPRRIEHDGINVSVFVGASVNAADFPMG